VTGRKTGAMRVCGCGDMNTLVMVQGGHRGGRMGHDAVREFWEGEQVEMG
jgi:hypothetical protein